MRYFEFVEGASKRFWEIDLVGRRFEVHWGRIGTDGQAREKKFGSPASAKAAHDELIAEKLRKGYVETKRRTPIPAKKASPVAEAWARIETILGAKAPEVRRSLAGPAARAKVAKLERELGAKLPADFAESLSIHDGQRGASLRLTTIFNNEFLLPTSQIAKQSRMMTGMQRRGFFESDANSRHLTRLGEPIQRDLWWRPHWLPFTDSDGSGFVLDLEPAKGGRRGQVFYFSCYGHRPRRVLAGSFTEWLQLLAADLEAGRFKIEDEGVWLGLRSKLTP